jgi:diamine N-acetyltransferase
LARVTYVAAFGNTFSSEDLSAYINKTLSDEAILNAFNEDVFLGATMRGELVGFIQFGAVRPEDVSQSQEDQELRRVYVLAGFQRKGVGSSLVKRAFQQSRLARASNVYLEVWERNVNAIAFYKRFGFNVIDRKRFAFPSGSQGDWDFIMARKSCRACENSARRSRTRKSGRAFAASDRSEPEKSSKLNSVRRFLALSGVFARSA